MKQLLHAFVTKKRERGRVCLLIVLAALAAGFWLGPDAAAPVEAPATGTLAGLHVALDPGHGGYDGGARGQESGLWEKELTLQIALAVEAELLARGAEVTLTRREDLCLAEGDGASRARKREDLLARRALAEAAGADVLMSIHLNEYRDRGESGPQVFYQRGGDAGRLLAGALQEALVAGLEPARVRQAMAGDYYVLQGKLPSVLVECGFLSNAREEALLMDAAYQRRIAQALADGLEQYAALSERLAQ